MPGIEWRLCRRGAPLPGYDSQYMAIHSPSQDMMQPQPTVDPTPRPRLGVALLIGSALVTLAILIYFGAWAASDRVSARSETPETAVEGNAAWEEGLLYVCPFH